MDSDTQEWEIAWYLERKEEKKAYLDAVDKALHKEGKILDAGGLIAVLLARLDS